MSESNIHQTEAGRKAYLFSAIVILNVPFSIIHQTVVYFAVQSLLTGNHIKTEDTTICKDASIVYKCTFVTIYFKA